MRDGMQHKGTGRARVCLGTFQKGYVCANVPLYMCVFLPKVVCICLVCVSGIFTCANVSSVAAEGVTCSRAAQVEAHGRRKMGGTSSLRSIGFGAVASKWERNVDTEPGIVAA